MTAHIRRQINVDITIIHLKRKPELQAPESIEAVYCPPDADAVFSRHWVGKLVRGDTVVQTHGQAETQSSPDHGIRSVPSVDELTIKGLRQLAGPASYTGG